MPSRIPSTITLDTMASTVSEGLQKDSILEVDDAESGNDIASDIEEIQAHIDRVQKDYLSINDIGGDLENRYRISLEALVNLDCRRREQIEKLEKKVKKEKRELRKVKAEKRELRKKMDEDKTVSLQRNIERIERLRVAHQAQMDELKKEKRAAVKDAQRQASLVAVSASRKVSELKAMLDQSESDRHQAIETAVEVAVRETARRLSASGSIGPDTAGHIVRRLSASGAIPPQSAQRVQRRLSANLVGDGLPVAGEGLPVEGDVSQNPAEQLPNCQSEEEEALRGELEQREAEIKTLRTQVSNARATPQPPQDTRNHILRDEIEDLRAQLQAAQSRVEAALLDRDNIKQKAEAEKRLIIGKHSEEMRKLLEFSDDRDNEKQEQVELLMAECQALQHSLQENSKAKRRGWRRRRSNESESAESATKSNTDNMESHRHDVYDAIKEVSESNDSTLALEFEFPEDFDEPVANSRLRQSYACSVDSLVSEDF